MRRHQEDQVAIYDKLTALGISLPPVAPSVAMFQPFVRSGNLIFVSGHIAKRDANGEGNRAPWVGQLGHQITTAEGREAARSIAVDLLATLHLATGDLNTIARIVKLLVLVNAAPTFTEPHLVANG